MMMMMMIIAIIIIAIIIIVIIIIIIIIITITRIFHDKNVTITNNYYCVGFIVGTSIIIEYILTGIFQWNFISLSFLYHR